MNQDANKGLLANLVGKVDGLMTGGTDMDEWKYESITSMNQLWSSLNDIIAM